jgi:lipopolysaccharide/colanic/teichoic acid biosynthesis glycosyltransferase
MSFVGARPDVEGYMDNLEGESRVLLSLRPGISGPATLKYRDEEEILALQDDPIQYNDEVLFPDKVRINLEYYRRCSLGLDLRIMLITAGLLKSKPTDFWMN